jgi:N-acetylmuramic acid 6-phosphate (MurNAc-6-P) etherase
MRQGVTDIKQWILMGITPVMMIIIGYLLNDKLVTIKETQEELSERLLRVEGLHEQITINTTDIGYLKESERENKEKLEIHLAAVLPEETKVKRR